MNSSIRAAFLRYNQSQMKVTTQRTNKFAKLLTLLGFLGILIAIYGMMTNNPWAVTVFVLSGIVWLIGKASSWWFNK